MALPTKKVYIRTFGCQMNVADSEVMAQVLADDYVLTERAEEADLYLINTCAIRRKSEEKVRSLLGSLKVWKKRRPQLVLGVGGCVAQQEGERLLAAAPHLDLVFGTQGIYRLPELVRRAWMGARPVDVELAPCFPPLPRRQWLRGPAPGPGHHHAGLRQLLHLLRGALCAGPGNEPGARGHPNGGLRFPGRRG